MDELMPSNKCLDVYLVRHTPPVLESSICYGHIDCPLAVDYLDEFNKLTDYFKGKKISAIYSSPLQRCAMLADALAAKQSSQVNVLLKDSLKEINFGDWEGIPWAQISQDEIEAWNADRLHFQFPNGETPYRFDLRVIKIWQEIINQHLQSGRPMQRSSPEKSGSNQEEKEILVIIAHGGVIRSILSDFLAIPFAQSIKLKIDKTSVSCLSFQGQASYCSFVNKRF